MVGQLGDLAGHLHSRRPRTHDDKGKKFLATLRIAGTLGLLEGAQDAAAQFQRIVDGLHARCPLGEVIVAEVGLARTRGDDQRVIRGAVRVAQQQRVDGLVGQVNIGDLTKQYLAVLLLAQDHPGGGSDLALGDDPGSHLIQHRLKQMVGGLGDQLDVHIGTLEFLRGIEAAETGTDDDDLVFIRWSGAGMAHLRSL